MYTLAAILQKFMTDQTSIKQIKNTEAEAETMIAQAHNDAREKKAELEEQMQYEFAHVADTLSKENSAIAEKVQADAQSFKETASAELKKRLADLEKGSEKRLNKAVKLVNDRFQDYVSQ